MEHKAHTVNTDRLIKTKIVCTLGPASSNEAVLEDMIMAGMDMVRLNFSHGEHSEHRKVFDIVRKLSAKHDNQVSIMCDIQGPKIRTGRMEKPFFINQGDQIKVTPDKIVGTPEKIQIKYETMLKDLHPGDTIFINDGIIKLVVKEVLSTELVCVCEAAGQISDHKGCNIPSGNISLNVITEKDAKDLAFIATLDPEYVASSFIGTAEDVQQVRKVLADCGNPNIKIVSKIERPIAVTNLDSIIDASDALMVARGDLGVEIPAWDVPSVQKEMVRKCNAAGKPVIVATQMLESMTSNSRPTRAEASDVFNAVLDGADAVMLSGESAMGKYPVESVKVMDNILAAAEKCYPKKNPDEYNSTKLGMTEIISHSCYGIIQQFNNIGYTGKMIVIADSGYTARMVSKYRPTIDIIAFTSDLRIARELNILWGVRTVLSDHVTGSSVEERAVRAVKYCFKHGFLKVNDHAVVVSRSTLGKHFGSTCAIYDVGLLVNEVPDPK
jgi:pyruvate kinase